MFENYLNEWNSPQMLEKPMAQVELDSENVPTKDKETISPMQEAAKLNCLGFRL